MLVDYLKENYTLGHEVVLYEAAQYPTFEPKIQKMPLERLPKANFSRISTLYVPPIQKVLYDKRTAEELGIPL